jgi:hypothetical protein
MECCECGTRGALLNDSNVSGRLQLRLQRVQPVVPVRRELHHQLLQQTERLQVLPVVRATVHLSITTLVITTMSMSQLQYSYNKATCYI